MRHPLFRLLAINLAIGVGAAVMTVSGLVYFNVHGLGELVRNSDSGYIAIGLLLGGFIITFGGTAMGVAIMTMPRDDDDDDKGGGGRSPEYDIHHEPVYARAR